MISTEIILTTTKAVVIFSFISWFSNYIPVISIFTSGLFKFPTFIYLVRIIHCGKFKPNKIPIIGTFFVLVDYIILNYILQSSCFDQSEFS